MPVLDIHQLITTWKEGVIPESLASLEIDSLINLLEYCSTKQEHFEALEKLIEARLQPLFARKDLLNCYPQIFSSPKLLSIVLANNYTTDSERLMVIRHAYINRFTENWEYLVTFSSDLTIMLTRELLMTIVNSLSEEANKKIILNEFLNVNSFYLKYKFLLVNTALLLISVIGIICSGLLIPAMPYLGIVTLFCALFLASLTYFTLVINLFPTRNSPSDYIASLAKTVFDELFPPQQEQQYLELGDFSAQEPEAVNIQTLALIKHGQFRIAQPKREADEARNSPINAYSCAMAGEQ